MEDVSWFKDELLGAAKKICNVERVSFDFHLFPEDFSVTKSLLSS